MKTTPSTDKTRHQEFCYLLTHCKTHLYPYRQRRNPLISDSLPTHTHTNTYINTHKHTQEIILQDRLNYLLMATRKHRIGFLMCFQTSLISMTLLGTRTSLRIPHIRRHTESHSLRRHLLQVIVKQEIVLPKRYQNIFTITVFLSSGRSSFP